MTLRLNDAAALAACTVILMFANAADTSSPMTGSWKISNWTFGDRVQFELSRRTLTSHWVESRDYLLDDLRGLTREQLRSLHSKVRFELARDAGVFICEGSVTAGLGGGTFQFSPSQAFAAELRSMGYGDVDANTLFSMAVNDVNMVFVRAVQKAGLHDRSVAMLIKLRAYGITPEYISDIRSAGYDYSAEDLVRLKSYGVRADFLRDVTKAGYKLSAEEAVKLHSYGVNAEYVRGVSEPGRLLSVDDLVKLKTYGVSPDYVQGLRAAGYNLTPADMVELRNQGVSTDYMKDLKRAGYNLTPRDIISLRQNGVAPEFLGQLNAIGYDRASTQDIIRMWQYGVRSDYIARLHDAFGAGARNLTPEQIIKLKVNGVD